MEEALWYILALCAAFGAMVFHFTSTTLYRVSTTATEPIDRALLRRSARLFLAAGLLLAVSAGTFASAGPFGALPLALGVGAVFCVPSTVGELVHGKV